MTRAGNHSGFTRADLVALTALASVCVCLAAPTTRRPAFAGRAEVCATNLGALGRAVQLYAMDHDNRLPGCQHAPPSWVESLAAYCSVEAYSCPALPAHPVSVALNDFLTPHPHGARQLNCTTFASIAAPSATLLFAEGEPRYLEMKYDHFHFADALENGFTSARLREQIDLERHGSDANYLLPDGHVERISATRALRYSSAPGSMFVHPQGASGEEYAAKVTRSISWN